jgi:hypothetical protein
MAVGSNSSADTSRGISLTGQGIGVDVRLRSKDLGQVKPREVLLRLMGLFASTRPHECGQDKDGQEYSLQVLHPHDCNLYTGQFGFIQ